jgi:AraC-like DNA-binding protein
MSTNVTSIWTGISTVRSNLLILPDGCRDLIVKIKPGHAPNCYVSPLFDQAKIIQTEVNTSTIGYRLKPGIQIAEEDLITKIADDTLYPDELENVLNEFTHLSASTEEVLACLAAGVKSINHASKILGVSTRTLQRFVFKETTKSPSYWLQLARLRKAGKSLVQGKAMAEVADQYGYSDQSHMCREFKRWTHCSPAEVVNSSEVAEQFNVTGYGF